MQSVVNGRAIVQSIILNFLNAMEQLFIAVSVSWVN